MYKIRTAHTQATTSKLLQDSKKTNQSVSFSTRVIPTTSVSRPQLKSNPKGDRVLRSNSGGKKLEVEEPRRNVKFLKHKMFVTACTDSLNAKTVNHKSISTMCAKSVMIKKHDLRVPKSVAKPLRKPVASDSIKKPRNNVRKLNEHFGKIYKWTYIKFKPSGLNAKTLNVKPVFAMCAKCLMINKHDLCVPKSVAKPLRKTVASESIKKPKNNVRKLHERFGKIYKWSYIKFTPSVYIWKPKSMQENVNPYVSMPLGNASRTANVKDTMTSRRSIVSKTPLSSNSFGAHRDCSIHRRLWVLKAHDGKY
nr:hypothetical protein [Tanacetum cinerariifolium]